CRLAGVDGLGPPSLPTGPTKAADDSRKLSFMRAIPSRFQWTMWCPKKPGPAHGEKMAVLCRQFGISRKTGYKIITRYNEIGLEGLTDRSRRPYRHANQLPFQIETRIVRLKQ